MRTTLDIDDKIMRQIKRKALDEQKSIKAIINEALATDLGSKRAPSTPKPYRCPSRSLGGPRVNLEKALSLADELEDEAVSAKLESRK